LSNNYEALLLLNKQRLSVELAENHLNHLQEIMPNESDRLLK